MRKAVHINEWFYRRGYSSPVHKYMNPDGTATSRVFKLREKDLGELSVDVCSLTSPEKSVGDPMKYFLFEISNKSVLNLPQIKLQTFYDPLPNNLNDAHAVIVGMTIEDEITPGLLARASKKVFI